MPLCGAESDRAAGKRRGPLDCSTRWKTNLKELAGMLPVPEWSGHGLTKKQTLLQMLRYLDFLQTHIQKLQTSPVSKEAGLWTSELHPMWGGQCRWPELEAHVSWRTWTVDRRSAGESCEEQIFTHHECCPACEGRTNNEGGSPGNHCWLSPPAGGLHTASPPCRSTCSSGSPALRESEAGLNLSPSLYTSPAHGLRHDLLPEGQEELQTLFEDVWVYPKTNISAVPSFHYKHLNGLSSDLKTLSSNCGGSLEEGASVPCARRNPEIPPLLKKKCVNGFLMFCRMNRKIYLRSHPGTPSTIVTKELASIWHVMPKQDRQIYCLKARQFSREQNRNVRIKDVEAEEEGQEYVPNPLHMLLAHRNMLPVQKPKINMD
ncbi:uncharacterized protein meiosin isoform X2 [Denticeps clupeoides]|uniref:uncharacterized protein meiosin isoform X2 n=1 Tax=Denticeps clupeoides TaxID=299321 RepID=UPI0010A531AC|nr:basic helix-loop-helix and HMG box domain-containing protein 1 isoform X2 [Denticeps clupeoides]